MGHGLQLNPLYYNYQSFIVGNWAIFGFAHLTKKQFKTFLLTDNDSNSLLLCGTRQRLYFSYLPGFWIVIRVGAVEETVPYLDKEPAMVRLVHE